MNTNSELEPEVIAALSRGKKIEAIKALREARGIGLKEAKEQVEAYAIAHNLDNVSVQKVSSNNGVVMVVFLAVAAYLIYHFFFK
ncbi:ribosomal protein L7/L12 [Alkalimarinus coralli]|uniref:ribosomal protein L7/L12 n=1 Tax=Alkalimarinus coralli TaxID=2935863 RepID=UPI00202B2732|nr:ribosomal protein L7/L12 [Alkalimarinus coralli]